MTMLFTILVVKAVAILLLLHTSQGRMLPSFSHRQSTRGRTLHPCPLKCTCYNHTVSCNSLQLSEVPTTLPANTKVLNLDDNHIRSIDFDVLSKLRKLEELHLRGNQIQVIAREIVTFLPRLKNIDLAGNPLVCDCNLPHIASRRQWPANSVSLMFGETRCASPEKYAGKKVSDVMEDLPCLERRKRNAEIECSPEYCGSDGTCVPTPSGPHCQCPPHLTGLRCEIPLGNPHIRDDDEDDVTLNIYIGKVTHHSVGISWNIHPPKNAQYYLIVLQEDDDWHSSSDEEETFRSYVTQYTFTDLQPTTWYDVCVEAYFWDLPFARNCDRFQTHQHPSSGHRPTDSKPGTSPHHPKKDHGSDELIHQAAVILGSVIGVCAFLIIFLTLGYKFRTLRHRRRSISTESPTGSANATTTETISDNGTTPNATDPTNPTNPTREIIILSVPSNSDRAASGEAGASALDEASEVTGSAAGPIPINSVLQALKQQGATRQPGLSSTNAYVVYHSGSNSNTGDNDAFPEENTSSDSPIFIVSNGTRYPIDPALSDVLRSAITGQSAQVSPIPNEPPPPYSERDEVQLVPPPLSNNGAVHGEDSITEECHVNETFRPDSPENT